MSKEKEIISKLFKVVAQQQQIITKLAQSVDGTTTTDLKASVQADVIDAIYGQGTKMVPGRAYPQVHYAKLENGALVVGLTVPANVQAKWSAMKPSLDRVLAPKYNATSVVWRE